MKTPWIRSPSSDGLRALSGLPIGLIPVALSRTVQQRLFTFGLLIALQTVIARPRGRRGKTPIVFAVVVITVGILCFRLLFVRATPTGIAIHMTMVAFGACVGLGLVHFLYDRHLYKLSGNACLQPSALPSEVAALRRLPKLSTRPLGNS
jgi:hypothetical protein